MRLTHLTIRNIGHLAEFDHEIPAVCLITGANGVGKSTILDALMYAAGRRIGPSGSRAINHDPSMLRGDAKQGEIIARFDDPDGNLEYLRCVVTESKTGRYIKARGATAYAEAGANLDTFFNALAYNPFALKAMEPKSRVENIMRFIPPAVTVDEIRAAAGQAIPGDAAVRADISEIQRIHDDLFSARTDVNREADTLEKQSKLLADAPGADDQTDWVSTLAKLRAAKAELEASEAEEVRRITAEFRSAELAAEKAESGVLADVSRDTATARDAVNRDIDAKIKALEAERVSRLNEVTQASNKRVFLAGGQKSAYIESARNKANAEHEEILAHNRPIHERLTSEIAAAQTRSEVQLQAEGARLAAIQTADKATEARGRARLLTDAIERLRELKIAVSKRMDLDGAIIASARGGPVDLCREEAGALVPFSRWNTRDKNIMCLRIALKAQAACGLVIIDSLGDFDEESLAELRDACRAHAERGVSFLIGDATRGPLKVEEWR